MSVGKIPITYQLPSSIFLPLLSLFTLEIAAPPFSNS